MARILVIDDDLMMCDMLSRKISRMGHTAITAHNSTDGLSLARQQSFDIVFIDVRLPDGNGMDIMPLIKQTPSQPEIIIITGLADPDCAEIAIKMGAWDYVQKGSSLMEIILPLTRALQYREEKTAVAYKVALKRDEIVGSSPQIKNALDLLAQAANTDTSVLLTGETGSGKEVFAGAIHKNSPRADKSFIIVDCAALPEILIESLLFGHRKGSFTGASENRVGLIKQADGGTLFLDEVGELPLALQKSFLRVLQTKTFRPIGSETEIESDFRLIAATNRNLEQMVEEGTFREDLLFRLKSFTIDLPPLRMRREDIKALTIFHTSKICDRFQIATKGFSPELFDALMSFDWPGNVRELVNTLERAITAAYEEPVIYPKHLPINIRVQIARNAAVHDAQLLKNNADEENRRAAATPKVESDSENLPSYKDMREEAISSAEGNYLKKLLASSGGNIGEACRISELSRSRLYSLLKKYGLTDKNSPEEQD